MTSYVLWMRIILHNVYLKYWTTFSCTSCITWVKFEEKKKQYTGKDIKNRHFKYSTVCFWREKKKTKTMPLNKFKLSRLFRNRIQSIYSEVKCYREFFWLCFFLFSSIQRTVAIQFKDLNSLSLSGAQLCTSCNNMNSPKHFLSVQ